MTPPQGGVRASEDDVVRALSEAGVMFGIDSAAIQNACQQGFCNSLLVASGVAPVDGVDAIFEELIPHTVDRKPKLDADGRIDYRERGEITVVKAGAPLMRRVPATLGFDGFTVRAQVLSAKPGHDEPFTLQLAGAEFSADDPNLLQAALSGQPVRVHCGVMVEPILRLSHVNMASGNIHFDGTVEISGEVSQGMKVRASGDIVVADIVDGGVLEAGGDIRVAGGVIAHARLRAAGSVTARFAQTARIEAGAVIALGDMALECELESLNQIIIGAEAPQRGRLIGGKATAMMLLQVPVLGSAKGGVTQVVLGGNRELETRYEALVQRIAQEKANEANLERLVKQLVATGDPKGMLARVKASRQNAVAIWGKLLAERSELEAQLELASTARLEVRVGVAGAVDLSIRKVAARLRRDFDKGTFALDAEGHVTFTSPSGGAVSAV
jgi:uncharacterized protein (DUF342 family)